MWGGGAWGGVNVFSVSHSNEHATFRRVYRVGDVPCATGVSAAPLRHQLTTYYFLFMRWVLSIGAADIVCRRRLLQVACRQLRRLVATERSKHTHSALIGVSLHNRRIAALYHPLQLQRCLLISRSLERWRAVSLLVTAEAKLWRLQA